MKTINIFGTLLLATTAGIVFTACSNQDDLTGTQPSAPASVGFTASVNNNLTRAGLAGEMDNTALESGFGVFAFYSDNVLYGQDLHPNFMYNEKVYKAGGDWTYDVLKYWPNEYGTEASNGDSDRLTFFAYAPWVDVLPINGLLATTETNTTTGITRLSRSIDKGDPVVHFVASMDPAQTVDLCWGVVPTDDGYTFKGADDNNEVVVPGTPWLNVYKPAADAKVKFDFKHALTALNVQIDANVDGSASTSVDANTRIYVRSVSFEGFALQGTLNLNNSAASAPLWLNYAGNAALPVSAVTVFDQRRNGREAAAADTNEQPGGLNPVLVQSDLNTQVGVSSSSVNLFNGATAADPVYVIPNGAALKVTIAYDVETVDPKLVGDYLSDGITNGSVVKNSITKSLSAVTLEAGKKYTLQLHLGLTSVKFDASVTDWDDTIAPETLVVDGTTTVDPGVSPARRI